MTPADLAGPGARGAARRPRSRSPPSGTVHLADRPLVFIPLKLAGEANAPLAAMRRRRPPTTRGCSSCRSRATATCASPSPPNWPRCVCPMWTASRGTRTVVAGAKRQPAPVQRRAADPRAQPGRRRVHPAARPLHPVPPHRRRLRGRPVGAAARPWLTFFAERAEYPGSSLLLAADRRARRCTGRPGRAPWRTPTSPRCSPGSTRRPGVSPARGRAGRRGPASLAAGRTGHRPGVRRRGARAGHRPRTTRRAAGQRRGRSPAGRGGCWSPRCAPSWSRPGG